MNDRPVFPALTTVNTSILAFADFVKTASPVLFAPFARISNFGGWSAQIHMLSLKGNFSSFDFTGRGWASTDLQNYRNNYPGQDLNNPRLQENFQFYSNKIPSRPRGDFIDAIHECDFCVFWS